MGDERDRKIRQIRQILALAEHDGTPPEEKENAFARAGALMYQYEIEEAEIRRATERQEEEIVLYEHPVTGKGGHGRQRAWALCAVAEGMGCEVACLANDSSSQTRLVMIVGPISTIENLKILLPAVLLQMENSAAKAARDHAARLPSWITRSERAHEVATVRRSFMRGFGDGIKAKLERARAGYANELHDRAAGGDETSASRELVLVSREQRVKAEFARKFPKLRKARRPKHFSPAAYHRGVKAGEQADLGDGKLPGSERPELG